MAYFIRFGGLLMLAFAWYFYALFTDFELNGGTVKSHTLVIMIYDFFGKWAVVSVFLLAALAWFRWSFRHLMLKRKGLVKEGKNPDGSTNMWA